MFFYDVKSILERGTEVTLDERLPELQPDDQILLPIKQPHHSCDEILVGILSDGKFCIAPDITDEREYQSQRENSRRKGLEWIRVYRLPRQEIPYCQGRNSTTPLRLVREILEQTHQNF